MSKQEELRRRLVKEFRERMGEAEYERLVKLHGEAGVEKMVLHQAIESRRSRRNPETPSPVPRPPEWLNESFERSPEPAVALPRWRARFVALGWLLLGMTIPGTLGAVVAYLFPVGAFAGLPLGKRLGAGFGFGLALMPVFWQLLIGAKRCVIDFVAMITRIEGKPELCGQCGEKVIEYAGKIPFYDHLGALKYGSRGTIWRCKKCGHQVVGPPLPWD